MVSFALEMRAHPQNPESGSSAVRFAALAVKVALLVLVFVHVCTFVLLYYRLFQYPYGWAASEGDHIYFAQRLVEGKTLYKDSNTFPLLGIGYPPGFYVLLAIPVKLLGPTVLSGRVLTVVVSALLVALLYKIVKKESNSTLLGLAVAVSILAYGPVSMYLAVIHMEALYVVLAIAGMYCISRHEKGRLQIVLAAICFAYAFFTKQLGLFGLGAAGLFLLAKRKYRECAELIIFFSLITIPVHLLINHLTGGWYNKCLFGLHMHRPFSWSRGTFLLGLIQTSPVVAAMACYGIFSEAKEKGLSPWLSYMICSLPVALLIFYDGTGPNYFLPLFSGLLILAGIGAGRIMRTDNSPEPKAREIWVYLLILFQLVTFCASRFYLRGPTVEDKNNLDQVAELIQKSSDPVLVDRMSSLILGTEHDDYFVQPVLLMYLYYSNQWDPDVIVSEVEAQRFSLICLFDRTQFVPPVVEAIKKRYRPVSSIPVRTIEPGIRHNLIIYARNRQ